MSLRINQNTMAMNANRNLAGTNNRMGKSLEKLSSGFRINRAADDAAGLVISENLRAQIGGLRAAVRNAQDGVSVVQTAEGALTEVHAMLGRMRELAVQAANSGANGGFDQESVGAAQAEIDQLVSAIDQIATTTEFNGTLLLAGTDGGAPASLLFQIGANNGENLSVSLVDVNTNMLGSAGAGTTVASLSAANALTSTATSAQSAIDIIDTAIAQVSQFRGTLGATQNRFEHTINNLNVAAENLAASESRIRDTDMAMEMTEFTRNQILQQAGTAMLAQANQIPQSVLSLLQG